MSVLARDRTYVFRELTPSPVLCLKVSPSHAKTNRNGAPVSVELPLGQPALATQPLQKTPSKGDTSTDQNQTASISSGLQATIKKATQGTRDRWKGSNESHTVLLTDPYTSPTLSPSSGEKCSRGKVTPCGQDSQAVTAIKTVKETKVELKTKAESEEVCRLLVQSDSQASHEKVETEAGSVDHIKPAEGENTNADEDGDAIIMNGSDKPTEETAASLRREENTTPELHRSNDMLQKSDPAVERQIIDRLNDSNLSNLQVKDFQEVQKPAVKVVSVAELLRTQIKALDSVLTHSTTTIPDHDNMLSHPTPLPEETYKGSKENGKWENGVKDSVSERGNGSSTEDTPPKNLKETLMELYHQLISDPKQPETPDATFQPAQATRKTSLITPVVNIVLPASPHVSAKNHETVNCLENGTSNWLSNQSRPVIQESCSPVAVAPEKLSVQESNNAVLKCDKDEPVQDKDLQSTQKITSGIKLTSKTPTQTQETALLGQYKLDEPNKEQSSFLREQKPSTKSETETDLKGLIQRDNPMVEEFLRIDGMANSTTASSPSLEKRNGISEIPSATAQELASGARRKIQKAKPEEALAEVSAAHSQTQTKEEAVESTKLSASPVAVSPSPRQSRRSTQLQPPSEPASPAERHSPLLSRRKMPPETESQQLTKDIYTAKPEGTLGLKDRKDLHDPFKGTRQLVTCLHIYVYISH